jgi:hypothetical protein
MTNAMKSWDVWMSREEGETVEGTNTVYTFHVVAATTDRSLVMTHKHTWTVLGRCWDKAINAERKAAYEAAEKQALRLVERVKAAAKAGTFNPNLEHWTVTHDEEAMYAEQVLEMESEYEAENRWIERMENGLDMQSQDEDW